MVTAKRKVATFLVSLLLIMAGVPAAADASSAVQDTGDLSSLPKIEAYLISMGVDLGSVVVQQGRLNYAGPNCPGSDWNCTDATAVIQIGFGQRNAQNFAECTPAETAANSCVILQGPTSGDNTAHCILRAYTPSATQTCNIGQTNFGGYNYVLVDQLIKNEITGSTQTGTQTSTIRQENATGANTAQILQRIEFKAQASGASINQSQQGTQQVVLCQGDGDCPAASIRAGENVAQVEQSQRLVLSAEGGSATQGQNDECDVPDTQAFINQQSGSGKSDSTLIQKHVIEAKATGLSATQTQGSLCGGLHGDVQQRTDGVKTSVGKQEEVQKVEGPEGSTQTQYGPEFCCSIQIGMNEGDSVDIDQASIQVANEEDVQESALTGRCSTTGGKCKVEQKADQNGVAFTPEPCEASSCFEQTTCIASEGEGSFCSTGEELTILVTCPPSCSLSGLSRADPAGFEVARLAPTDWISV